MAASITDTQGIIAIAAAAVAVVALLGMRRAGCQRAPPAPRAAAGARRAGEQRDLVAHAAAHAGGVRGAAASTSRTRRSRLDGRLAGVETALRGSDRPPRARALRRLQRAVRAPVDVDRAARRRAVGDRAVLHPPPRPGARVRQAGARRAGRTGALPGGGRGRAPGAGRQAAGGRVRSARACRRAERAPAGTAARVGYLGPGGNLQRGGAAGQRAAGRGRARFALASIYDTVMALRRGEVEWAIVPIENSLEGSISVTLDLLAGEAERRADRGRGAAAGQPLADRRRGGGRWRRSTRCSPTRRCPDSARGSCAASSRTRADPAGQLDRRGGAQRGRRAAARAQAALGTVLAAEIYGGTVIREGVQDRDDNETRFVWLGAARASAERARRRCAPATARRHGRPRWCSGAPGAERPGWLVRCLDEFARREINLTKIESRPRRERLGQLHVLRRPRRARASEQPVAEALAGPARACASRCACSAPTAAARSPGRR